MNHLQHIASLITSFPQDIRAEVIINDLIQSGDLKAEDYTVLKEGQFSRAYRFDVLDAKVADSDDEKAQLVLNLSRDSMYDTLPQGIFHNSQNDTSGKDVDVMIREYYDQKKQQKEARKFFQPFENEMFEFGVEIENFESSFLSALNGTKAPDLFYTFWNMSRDFPPLLISKFIRLLPFTYKIVGNISQACHILSILLEEEITVNERGYQKYADDSKTTLLGETRLGLDSITGTQYDDYSRHIDIKIGPLKKSTFTDFIYTGKKKKFVDMFCEYFFPLEIEITTIILLQENEEKFDMSRQTKAILGYNTCI
ncbi:type VI secretion system baseplate subunit TssG [Chryseobacterium sp. MHB01]|uniref:type VI secretion system baseplate subunit TssG n=1 Tax=Chryseobacterium sp. MHB01 TaxID=3109433 RepID=UPI002AFE44FF|nr:type VI secretion system baseplate subunit TssG [Chryseobacterium sp. MHB01]MEA1850753.1 type VI secretion system baseplate subunit TssG [Chryseobacterium sp. MHB01]